jgi:hypothetical protein
MRGDELAINQETGVLTVSREDGFEQTTTRHSPPPWQSVTQRNPGQGVRLLLISTARRYRVDRTADLQQTPIKSTIIGPQFAHQGACDQGFCGLRPFLWTWVAPGLSALHPIGGLAAAGLNFSTVVGMSVVAPLTDGASRDHRTRS